MRREEILAATVGLIDTNGLAQTRVKDVADALGISAGLVFYHFATKDALLAAAFRHAVQQDLVRLEQTMDRYHDPVERLRRILAVYGPQGGAPGWRVWIDAWALAQREPSIRRVLRHLDDEWAAGLLRTIEDGVGSDGSSAAATRAASVARISALLDGLSVATLVYRSVTRTQLRTWVREATAREVDVDPTSSAEVGRDDTEQPTSHQPVRGVVGVGQGGPVQPERRQVGVAARRSTASSASSRPNVGANLNPCAAPMPTTTASWPGTGPSTKSRSGTSV